MMKYLWSLNTWVFSIITGTLGASLGVILYALPRGFVLAWIIPAGLIVVALCLAEGAGAFLSWCLDRRKAN